ncbi:Exocyst complex component 1 [Binucleata daphniae]
MHGQEIDKIFLYGQKETKPDTIQTIKEYISNASNYTEEFKNLYSESNEHLKIFYFYQLKLENLSKEMQQIEQKNDYIELQIKNKKMLYNELKNLLVSIEIKPEHFTTLENQKFDDLTTINISLNVLKSFYGDYDILVVNEVKEKVKNTLKTFTNNFIFFFQKKLNMFSTESKGELKIHTKIYEEIKKYEFVFDYCKESDTEAFVVLSRKYLYSVKFLYEKEFNVHLSYLIKALKGYKEKLKIKLEDVISVLFESFFVVLRCENNFIKSMFYDTDEFANNFIKSMFTDVLLQMNDFLINCSKINNVYTINAINKSKNIKNDLQDYNIEIINEFKQNIIELIDDFKTSCIRDHHTNLRLENRKKVFMSIIQDVKNNSYTKMNDELIDFFIIELKKMHKKNKGPIEFCFYRLELINDMIHVQNHNKKDALVDYKKQLEKSYEKELIGYVFGSEERKLKMRVENVLELMKDMFGKNELFYKNMYEFTKNILYDNVGLEKKDVLDKIFKK